MGLYLEALELYNNLKGPIYPSKVFSDCVYDRLNAVFTVQADIFDECLDKLSDYVNRDMSVDYNLKRVDYLFKNLDSLKLYTNSYEKIIRFTGYGSQVEVLTVGNDDWLHEGKKVDLICKSNKEISIFDTLSWTKTQPIWEPKEKLDQVVENRIQEILTI
jgi:hypothetical protein